MSVFLGWQHELVRGVGMTLLAALVSLVFALVLGVLVALAKQARSRILRSLGTAYTTIIRGTPELLIIFFVYFGSTIAAGKVVALLTGAQRYVEVPTFVASVISLTIIFGGYMAESIRGGILALPKGQIEAADAFGFSRLSAFFQIKLPLIWRYALPALGNNWLSLIKATSLISMVGLEELMRKSNIAAGQTREYFRFYAIAAVIYLILTLINVIFLDQLEKYTRRSEQTL